MKMGGIFDGLEVEFLLRSARSFSDIVTAFQMQSASKSEAIIKALAYVTKNR